MLDLLFRDITITDGSGKPSYIGSVGVKDGKITFSVDRQAREVVEGDGLTLCPGFIDAHSHGDMSIGCYPATICKISQGVTSEIGGMCGDGCFPVDRRFIGDMSVFANMTHDYLKMPYETFTDLNSYITYADPNCKPEGIEAVYVAGQCAYRNKELTDAYNGKMLRRKSSADM